MVATSFSSEEGSSRGHDLDFRYAIGLEEYVLQYLKCPNKAMLSNWRPQDGQDHSVTTL